MNIRISEEKLDVRRVVFEKYPEEKYPDECSGRWLEIYRPKDEYTDKMEGK